MNENLPRSLISFKEASDIYLKQSDGVHRLWAYFQGVSLAVLGFTIGGDKGNWQLSSYLLLALSYLAFALGNQWVLVASQAELDRSGEAVRRLANQGGEIEELLVVVPVKPGRVWAFHFGIVLIVSVAIIVAWWEKAK